MRVIVLLILGAVYIYYYDTLNGTWTQEARLKAWDVDSEDLIWRSFVSIYQSGSLDITY